MGVVESTAETRDNAVVYLDIKPKGLAYPTMTKENRKQTHDCE